MLSRPEQSPALVETIVPVLGPHKRPSDGGAASNHERAKLVLKHKNLLPFGAKGWISTRNFEAEPTVSGTTHIEKPALAPETAVDTRTRLAFWSCPGLTVVGVSNSEEFARAVTLITSRQRTPRDKGAIILPRAARFRINTELRELARLGIVVRAFGEENEDLQAATKRFAQEFVVRQARSQQNLAQFMNNRESSE